MNEWMMCAAYNWSNWSHYQRMNFLRSLRLHIIAEKKREEREQAFKEFLFEQWFKQKEAEC